MKTIAFYREKFDSKLDKSGTCWVWTGNLMPTGYGVMYFLGKNEYSHRIAYRLANGEIPKGMHVCHTCDNPPCCNPDHLWLGTATQNIADREAKGRGKGGFTTRMTWDQVRELRTLYQTEEFTKRDLARRFGISSDYVRSIVMNQHKLWYDAEYTPPQEDASIRSSRSAKRLWERPEMREKYEAAIRNVARQKCIPVTDELRAHRLKMDTMSHVKSNVKRAKVLGWTEEEIRIAVIDALAAVL